MLLEKAEVCFVEKLGKSKLSCVGGCYESKKRFINYFK